MLIVKQLQVIADGNQTLQLRAGVAFRLRRHRAGVGAADGFLKRLRAEWRVGLGEGVRTGRGKSLVLIPADT